ncbi:MULTISPECIES: glycine betaine ABC transporter substrate-binding protein [Anaerotruncus]|uniref:Glycine/betaine ABC transporter substrate-binding protein n=1 Tax=Anaerotruncus massiliensis (ex Togo et al. 2019) TaxID=1673720 RepID=A0ABR7AEB1_9FIRM|nr:MULTISPECIES: glycine betaine ABC transporter substrate-binding protein [Anaerotruncus]MBC3938784.1 glycine/betaine ABC transporter substrate-binding protein [Anaerotruncus massiliensis (ex Togo et al. 2019)]
MKHQIRKVLSVLLAVLLFAGVFSGCGKKDSGVVKIATKPMTEQFILSEMLAQLIEQDTVLTVEITKGIGGGTTNIHPALLKGDFDLYPEYTGTAWAFVVKREDVPDDDTLYAGLQEAYQKLGLKWTGLYGFNNTFALAVRRDVAEQYGIETYSDIAKVSPELVFGANPDFFEKADGFPHLAEAYGMNFKSTSDIDIGLKYKALENGDIDVTNAFTTDAQLSVADITLPTDDKHLFTNYYCGTVVRMDTLEKHPELEPVLEKMNGLITDAEMASMNYQVEVENRDEKEVAKEFLTSKGLLK